MIHIRTNVPMRRVRIAVNAGQLPAVRTAREAIRFCADMAERYAATNPAMSGAYATEAMEIAPYAIARNRSR